MLTLSMASILLLLSSVRAVLTGLHALLGGGGGEGVN